MDIMPPDNQLPPHHAPTGLKLWLAVFGVVLVIALGYLVWAQNTAPDTTDYSTAVTKKTTANETADWKTYTNSTFGFSIKYPTRLVSEISDWEFKELPVSGVDNLLLSVGFRPSTLKEDYRWGANVYGKATGLESLIKDIGDQFSDRKEKRETITVGGMVATLVTVTTPSMTDWVDREVFIESGDYIFSIGNGAVNQSEFDLFYKSFRLTE